MQLSVKKFDLACLAGLVLIAFLGVMYTLRTASASRTRTARLNQAYQEQVARLQEAQSVRDNLNRILKSNEQALTVLQERIPDSRGIGEFLARLDKLTATHKVGIDEITPATPTTESLFTKTPLSFSCRGAFAHLHAVLYDLEHLDQLVQVDRITIERDSLSQDCKMNATCSVYGL